MMFRKHEAAVPAWIWALAGAGAAVGLAVARRPTREAPQELWLRSAITIQAPAERIYELWRDPQVHAQLRQAEVTPLEEGGTRWRWQRAFGHGGAISGEVRLTREQPPVELEWVTEKLEIQLRAGLPVRHAIVVPHGWLQLVRQPGSDEGREATEVRLRMALRPAPPVPWAGGRIQAGMNAALRRLRMLAETGVLASTAGQAAGRRSRKGRELLWMLEDTTKPRKAS